MAVPTSTASDAEADSIDNSTADDTTATTVMDKVPDHVAAQVKSIDQQPHKEVAPTRSDRPVCETRESYGPPGFRGLLTSHYVLLCASFSAMGGLLFGYDQGVVSVILVMPQFLEWFPQVSASAPGGGFYKGLLTAMIELGALLVPCSPWGNGRRGALTRISGTGAFNQGWIADKVSRKYSIVLAVIIFTIGSALQTAAQDYAMLVVARLIGGIGIGMLSMVAPLFISEISPPEIRGALLVLEEFSIVFGIVVAYWITYGTRFIAGVWSWRLPFVLQILPGLVLGFGILFMPFSPRWLASKGRDQESLKNLAKLRQLPSSDSRVIQEWYDIRAEVAFHAEIASERHPKLFGSRNKIDRIKLELVAWVDCFRRGCWRRTHVGMGLMFFQQFVGKSFTANFSGVLASLPSRRHSYHPFCFMKQRLISQGINALIYYAPTLFETMGQEYDMQLVLAGVLNVAQLVGVASSVWSMDRYGRRPLLLWGAVVMCVSHVIIAILVGLFDDNWPAHKAQGWTSVAFLFVYMLAFGASWGPVPWAMPAEIFPSSLRAKGVALSTCSNWLNNFIIGLITPPLVQNTGFGAYTFFAVFCLLALLWTFFFIPETNGRSLEQMDQVFKDLSSEEEDAKRARIEAAMMGSIQVASDQGSVAV
ncbi:putative MFS monosaccharide transporter [Phyllosticta citriasiana]|uniref:putative MFS monosaccharide transporter n=1 Tax=Phyllosticta citriasiana TaxID=595635 RepID=UPI0030FD72C1